MTGESNLKNLLASMSPTLMDGEYVFCSFEGAKYGSGQELKPVAACMEKEGLTLVIPRANADQHGLSYEPVFRGLTLTVHSSLEAVGLTAALATKLSQHGISANVIAGYFHDHIFVRSDHAAKAMAALSELA